ncbi:Major facilitator superfamily domain general substrate transporter [Penicillium odoratum]|uniref:Major facilitator superfamily domain general substrate transporter n=1 Tax=Penicillium odoratum TaxID=1167516 RepID=UPI0025491DC5|nr:Major facilitator superfamily domain general substrate transporter [Penicillium odoratum]KAJ5752266.1 Major facilitator superfamily domain general substrate transporter [Penicillium odoratum]
MATGKILPTGKLSTTMQRTEPEKPTCNDTMQENDDLDDEEYITGFKLWAILISGTLVQFVMMLDRSIIATAVPYITDEFHSLLDVGWYGSAYQLASAALQPLTGKLYTHLKIKWTFFAFFFIFELGSQLCAIAKSSKILIIARAIAGLGGSGLLNDGLTMISACLPKHKRPAAMGLIISIRQLGQALGPLIGGAFTEKVTWRWFVFLYEPPPIGGIVLALLASLDIPDRIAKPDLRTLLRTIVTTLDILGFLIFAPAAIMFFLAFQYGGSEYPWNSATVIGLLVGAGITFLVFLGWEYHRGDNAMIPLFMLRKIIIWSSCLTMFFITGVLTCGAYYLPIYFQAVKGASPIMSGVYYLPNILLQITMAMLFGFYLPWVFGGTALASIGYSLLTMLTPTYETANRVGFQILAGAGLGSAAAMPFVAVQNLIPHAQISVVMAILVFSLNFGGATSLTFAETNFSQSLPVAISKYAPGVNASAIISAGATGFWNVVPADQLADVLKAYSESVDHVFYLVCGSAAAAFCCAWGMGWQDIRKSRAKEQAMTTP